MPLDSLDLDLQQAGMSLATMSAFPADTVCTLRPETIQLGTCADGSPALVWNEEELATPDLKLAEGECLRQFLALRSAATQPDRVLSFARQFGLLGICEHWRADDPRGQHLPSKWFRDSCMRCSQGFKGKPQTVREPIDDWTFHAGRLYWLLIIVSEQQQGSSIPTEKLSTSTFNAEWDWARGESHLWLWHAFRVGEVSVEFTLRPGIGASRWSTHIHGLQGLLAMELAAALLSPSGVRRCQACGNPYSKRGKTFEGGYKFCSKKCTSEGARARSARYYAKKRAKQQVPG